MYRGNIALGQTIDIKFTTRAFATGAPTTLSGSPAVAAYVGNGTTEITAGITLSVDFDSRTGLNNVRVVASGGNGFAASTDVQLVITAGTVGGTSVVGEVVAEFSIENRSLSNTATQTLGALTVSGATTLTGNVALAAGLTITQSSANISAIVATGNGTGHGLSLVSGSGATGNGLNSIAASTNGTGLNLLGTGTGNGMLSTGGAGAGGDGIEAVAGGGVPIRGDITANITGALSGAVGSVTGAVGSVTGNVGGNVTGSVGSVVGAVGSVTGAVGSVTGNVGGNVTGSVGSVVGAVGSVTGNVGGNVVGSVASVAGQTLANLDAAVTTRATPAQVATQVDGVLNTNTKAELAGVPAANASLGDKLTFMEMKIRNAETQTATQATIADTSGAVIGTAAVSDDGTTFTKGKYA